MMAGMKLALLSDIHANLHALQACLAHARAAGAQQFALLGDLVGYGAFPGEVVRWAMQAAADGAIVLRGNHDAAAAGPPTTGASAEHISVAWTRTQLSETERAFLAGCPLTARWQDVLLVHASAQDPERWIYLDRPERAAQMGARLAVNAVIGGATPESKLAEVAAAQAAGLHVAMVGDGINDAPVLARANVSFAMGQGALVTRAQADAVVASNRLGDLVLAHDLAGRCMRVVRQNMLWAAVYNAVCIPLALVGWLPPWAAGLGMATSSLLVIGNSMRLARSLQPANAAQLTAS